MNADYEICNFFFEWKLMVMRVQRVIYFHAPGDFLSMQVFGKFSCSDAQVTSKAILLMR